MHTALFGTIGFLVLAVASVWICAGLPIPRSRRNLLGRRKGVGSRS